MTAGAIVGYEVAERAAIQGESRPKAIREQIGFRFLTYEELCAPLEPVHYAIEALDMCPGRPVQLTGTGFSGKTIAMQSMAVSVIAGRRVWGQFFCRQGKVAHLDWEMGRRASLRRYRRLCLGLGVLWEQDIAPQLRFAPLPTLYLNSRDAEEHLKRGFDGCALAIVDSLRRSLPGEDENDSVITRYIDVLGRASEATDCTVAFLHHSTTKKGPEGDQRGAGRGSSAIYDACGAVLAMSGKRGEPVLVSQTKAAERGTPAEDFYLAIEDIELEGDQRGGVRVVYKTVEQVKGSGDGRAELDADVRRVVEAVRREGIGGVSGVDSIALLASMNARRGRAAVKLAASRGLLLNIAKKPSGEPDGVRPRYAAFDVCTPSVLKGTDADVVHASRPGRGADGLDGVDGVGP